MYSHKVTHMYMYVHEHTCIYMHVHIHCIHVYLQVNGVDVLNSKLVEVKEMIRESPYVTLTLLGKLSQNGTKSACKYMCNTSLS